MGREDRRRRFRIARRKVGGALLPILAPTILRTLSSSWKIERLGFEHYERVTAGEGALACIWHGRMLLPMRAHARQNLHVLVSPSDDGSLVTWMLERFGYHTIRGSSNKSPARALRRMLGELERGALIVITPDGPRGPRHSVNPGPAWMARATGLPILPCGFVCDEARYLKSWDRFTIPKFGARVVLSYGEPMHVSADAGDDAVEEATRELRARMLELEERGFAHLGTESDH